MLISWQRKVAGRGVGVWGCGVGGCITAIKTVPTVVSPWPKIARFNTVEDIDTCMYTIYTPIAPLTCLQTHHHVLTQ